MPGLLQTCRVISAEASGLYYAINHFRTSNSLLSRGEANLLASCAVTPKSDLFRTTTRKIEVSVESLGDLQSACKLLRDYSGLKEIHFDVYAGIMCRCTYRSMSRGYHHRCTQGQYEVDLRRRLVTDQAALKVAARALPEHATDIQVRYVQRCYDCREREKRRGSGFCRKNTWTFSTTSRPC